MNTAMNTAVTPSEPQSVEPLMSSKQIAELVGSRHDNVKQTMVRLTGRSVIQLTAMQEVNHKGQNVQVYMVNERDSYIVVAQLSPEFTAKLVDEWKALKEGQEVKIPQSLPEALRLAADLADRNAALELKVAVLVRIRTLTCSTSLLDFSMRPLWLDILYQPRL